MVPYSWQLLDRSDIPASTPDSIEADASYADIVDYDDNRYSGFNAGLH